MFSAAAATKRVARLESIGLRQAHRECNPILLSATTTTTMFFDALIPLTTTIALLIYIFPFSTQQYHIMCQVRTGVVFVLSVYWYVRLECIYTWHKICSKIKTTYYLPVNMRRIAQVCCWSHLLDQGVRSEESVVLLRELLDQVLVLVELLQVLHRHAVKPDLLGLWTRTRTKRQCASRKKAGQSGG